MFTSFQNALRHSSLHVGDLEATQNHNGRQGFECTVRNDRGEAIPGFIEGSPGSNFTIRGSKLKENEFWNGPPSVVRRASESLSRKMQAVFEDRMKLTSEEIQPYLQVEIENQNLFDSESIRNVGSSQLDAYFFRSDLTDVDMGKADAVVVDERGRGMIGTTGSGPCFSLCARGVTADGRPVLGLKHYDGAKSADEAYGHLFETMQESGSVRTSETFVLGGLIAPEASEAGTLDLEQDLLDPRLVEKYNVRGARTHASRSEFDRNGKQIETGSNSIDVVLTPDQLMWAHNPLV